MKQSGLLLTKYLKLTLSVKSNTHNGYDGTTKTITRKTLHLPRNTCACILYEKVQKLLHLCETEVATKVIIEIKAENIKVIVVDRK